MPLALAAIFTAPVNAYELHDYKWPSAETTFYVNISSPHFPYIRELGSLWNRAFEQAAERWNQATIFNFGIRHTYEDPCDGGTRVNGVGFASDICGEDSFGPSGTSLAVTLNWRIGTLQTESNIVFNSEYSWRVYDGPAINDPIDFRRVAVHELGHALGLGHEEYARSIMAASGDLGDIIIRPQADDIAGVAALYEVATPPRPFNDDYSKAIGVSHLSGRVTSSNVNASTEPGEPGLGSKSVWWWWQAPATGRLTVDTTGSNFDTVLGVYTGTRGRFSSLRSLAENDDTNGQQSRVDLDVTEGTSYWFRVAGYNGDSGSIVLNWNLRVSQIMSGHTYIFPQFAFGGGWQSILMMLGPHRDTSCTFTAEGRYIETDGPQGIELNLSFDYTWRIFSTTAPPSQEASSGMAILDCDKEVHANVLFSLRVSGSVVGEALVEPAEELAPGGSAYFISGYRGGGRLALAVANPSNHPLPVRVRLSDGNNVPPSAVNTTVDIPANSAKSFFLDELGTIPEDHVGLVRIWASRSVYAIGLKTTGPVFTTFPSEPRYESTICKMAAK